MISIIDRKAFQAHFNELVPGMADDDSQLWAPEIWEPNARPSQWFVYTRVGLRDKGEYWAWIRDHCQGSVLCYSSSEAGDWWGFERREDILIWVMRWVG